MENKNTPFDTHDVPSLLKTSRGVWYWRFAFSVEKNEPKWKFPKVEIQKKSFIIRVGWRYTAIGFHFVDAQHLTIEQTEQIKQESTQKEANKESGKRYLVLATLRAYKKTGFYRRNDLTVYFPDESSLADLWDIYEEQSNKTLRPLSQKEIKELLNDK